jgi:glutamine amidotransferase-like uncharacterized protein
VGFVAGPKMLAGMLAGSLAVGATLSLIMANGGGAWDNAKKFIEKGGLEGHKKGSDAHKAAVVGDTVGDPFKDTSGPGIAILIKVMSVVSLLIAPLIAESLDADGSRRGRLRRRSRSRRRRSCPSRSRTTRTWLGRYVSITRSTSTAFPCGMG